MRSSNFIFPPFAFLEFSQVLAEYAMAGGKERKSMNGGFLA
jgi:hypothetical protein